MNRAFLVAGPESSGNRALAALLVAAGCQGEGSTNQPQGIEDIPEGQPLYVLIQHRRLAYWSAALIRRGYGVRILILVREPHATACSACKVGHHDDYWTARSSRRQCIAENIGAAEIMGLPWEIVTYESLEQEGARRALLRWCDLPESAAAAKLALPGQLAPDTWQTRNQQHYEGDVERVTADG